MTAARSFLTSQVVYRGFRPSLKATDLPAGVIGQVAGIAVVYDELDGHGTIFSRGSLDRTSRERVAAGKVKLFFDHGDAPITGMYDSHLHIGTVKSLQDVQMDDGRWGAYMTADLFNTPEAQRAKSYLESVLATGGETGLSVGCNGDLVKHIRTKMELRGGEAYERILEFPLSEISITSMQAVPDSAVLAVRQEVDVEIQDDPTAEDVSTAIRKAFARAMTPDEDLPGHEPHRKKKKKKLPHEMMPTGEISNPQEDGGAMTTHASETENLEARIVAAIEEGTLIGTSLDEPETAEPMEIRGDRPTASVNGTPHPASDFAYVPDPEKPSTWKFPIFDEAHARNALARFNQADLPAADKPKVWRKILAACKKFGIEVSEKQMPGHKSADADDAVIPEARPERLTMRAAFAALAVALPREVVRSELVTAGLADLFAVPFAVPSGDAQPKDSDGTGPTPVTSNAAVQDSRATKEAHPPVAYATMEERLMALRRSYTEVT